MDKWPSTIFKAETRNLQEQQKVSKLAIALYVKPYECYKSVFEARRAKTKTKMPSNLDQFDLDDPSYQKHKVTIDNIDFLQYDNRRIEVKARIQIFVFQIEMQYLSESQRWQVDGTFLAHLSLLNKCI